MPFIYSDVQIFFHKLNSRLHYVAQPSLTFQIILLGRKATILSSNILFYSNTESIAHLLYGLIHSSKGRLFVVVVNPSVSMQYVDAVLFG